MWILVPLLLSYVYAADPVNSAIETAQGLALKKNRQEAAKVLSQAIDETKPPLKGRARLIEVLGNISKVFFTDKGQKLFESGQSAVFENPDGALAQFREALALEDDNILILNSISRLQFAKQDCQAAALTVQKARALDVYSAEPAVLELKALICQKDFTTFREKLKTLPPLEKGQEAFVQYLLAQDLMQQKLWRKATDVLLKINELQPRFPEPYYLLTKAGEETGSDTDAWAEKYIALCKGLTVLSKRQFPLEPKLCANAKEVEDELAKRNSDN